jgi:hypothetical protein
MSEINIKQFKFICYQFKGFKLDVCHVFVMALKNDIDGI